MNPRKTLSGETVIWADCLQKKSILAISGPNIDRENFSREHWASTRPDGLDGGLEKFIRPRFCKMGTLIFGGWDAFMAVPDTYQNRPTPQKIKRKH